MRTGVKNLFWVSLCANLDSLSYFMTTGPLFSQIRNLRLRGLDDLSVLTWFSSCIPRVRAQSPVCLQDFSFSQKSLQAQHSFSLALLLGHLFISAMHVHQEYYGGQELQLSIRLTHLGPRFTPEHLCDPEQVA